MPMLRLLLHLKYLERLHALTVILKGFKNNSPGKAIDEDITNIKR